MNRLDHYRARLAGVDTFPVAGRLRDAVGNLLTTSGPPASLGDLCQVEAEEGPIAAEVVGFRQGALLLMPLAEVAAGIRPGCRVRRAGSPLAVGFSPELLGRVLDALGRPLDGRPAPASVRRIGLDGSPPSALERRPICHRFETGVRVLDGLLTLGRGQRIGLFAGSGVGKSTLMGMIARGSCADVNIIALVGERGREVQEFLDQALGPEGRERSVVVVATSDEPPLLRIKAALTATALAEAFREEGREVCLMMDSVTRVATARREIGLASGEPPTTRGYTPSVFSMLPRLLERSGTSSRGSITAIYTVLVEGDDFNEPVADTVRGILDGHVVLSRELAHQGHYPAVDVLASVSRLMKDLVEPDHWRAALRAREVLAAYRDSRDLLAVGAYQPGSSPEIDRALALKPRLDEWLRQGVEERTPLPETRRALLELLPEQGP